MFILIKKVFLKIIKFFKKKEMSLHKIYTNLTTKSSNFLDEFSATLVNHSNVSQLVPITGGMIDISDNINIPNFSDFNLLGYNFCIERRILSTRKQCIFRTYFKEVNNSNYPNILLHKIPISLIVMDELGNKMFNDYNGGEIETLLVKYIAELIDWIKEIEKSES